MLKLDTLALLILQQLLKLTGVRYSITTHKVIAIVSFLILSSVQFFLLYNTYELEDEHYFLTERAYFNEVYTKAITDDKVMPGGQAILDKYLEGNIHSLEKLYITDRRAFDSVAQRCCDSAFRTLQKANNIDSVMSRTIDKYHLTRHYTYALLIEQIDLAFKKQEYVPLYAIGHHYKFIDPVFQSPDGIRIGGTLKHITTRNKATALTVSDQMAYSSRLRFSFHVDIPNRRSTIILHMLPTFMLSLFSILSVVMIFFITFRNWLKQKKLSEMKSDFINSITHEFHTPLSAIIVANKTMQKEKILSNKESLRPLTEVVQRQAERLKVLISQVLDITTLNKIPLKREDYSLHHLLDEILLDYRLKLIGNSVRFSLHKEAEGDTVSLDRFWFTTILQNIFDNAIKYNNSTFKEITVTTFDDKKFIYLSIRDNGIGMKEETKKQVFEKFYRHLHPAETSIKGLGLGLFYVKQAVDAHNWKIEIISIEGQGSTFVISIPI